MPWPFQPPEGRFLLPAELQACKREPPCASVPHCKKGWEPFPRVLWG